MCSPHILRVPLISNGSLCCRRQQKQTALSVSHLDGQELALALPAVQNDGQSPRAGAHQLLRHLLHAGQLVRVPPGGNCQPACR